MLNSTSQSILDAIKNYFEKNETYTKKEFIDIIKVIYDNNAKNKKKSRKTKEDGEEKEKKPLNDYQIFMKEQRAIINVRESDKDINERLNTREIMKEIAEKWQLKKKGLLEDTKEFLKSNEEEEKEINEEEKKTSNKKEEKTSKKTSKKKKDDN